MQTHTCLYRREPSHLEPLCIRYIYPQVYIYRMIDTFVYELKLCEITCVSALPVYTLKLFVYKHILTSIYIYISIFLYMNPCCANSHTFVPLASAHTLNLLYTSTFSEVYIFHIIESFVEGSLEVKLPTIWTVEKQR